MKIHNITIDICISSLQGYEYDPSHTSTELILDANRYKKYVRLYLLDKPMGYVSKKDTPLILNVIKSMNKYVRVSEWSLVTKTQHYLILKLHLCSYKNCKYYIYQLSFPSKDMYIGSTVNLIQRLTSHKKNLKNKTHVNHLLQKAFDQYLNDMEVNILYSAETNDKTEQFQKEQEFISKYQSSLNLINSYTPKGKVLCKCGKQISHSSLKSHKKSKYHKTKIISNIINSIVDSVVS